MHHTAHTSKTHSQLPTKDAMQREELKWLSKTASNTLDNAQGVLEDLSHGVTQLGKQLRGNSKTVRLLYTTHHALPHMYTPHPVL